MKLSAEVSSISSSSSSPLLEKEGAIGLAPPLDAGGGEKSCGGRGPGGGV